MKGYEALTAITIMAMATVLPMGAFQQPASPDASALQDRPTAPVVVVQGTVPCEVQGPIIRIPSQSAPDGIQVRLLLPAAARYPEGAPIVVHSTATASMDRVHACLRAQGFVDVVYHCPSARERLTNCSEQLADVLAFATGRIRSLENKSIDGHTGDVKADTANVGLVGWSAGGNRAVLTMARYGDGPRLKRYASWESPMLSIGDSGGSGTIYQPNPFYDASAGTVDLNRLRYSADMPLWVWPPRVPPVRPIALAVAYISKGTATGDSPETRTTRFGRYTSHRRLVNRARPSTVPRSFAKPAIASCLARHGRHTLRRLRK